ncbi:peptidase M23 [Sulfuricella denitrificans skB26]|uniref:Peptidase M23 n=1 Tax=Sulfuricella denitrificans (strain DSM 22764 / NBRC 105220 / skB26) TaxID=1163617 RepID=S6B7A1_SULDS|nr:M23 family metallopeptidase [Sulfuricella denitrificans]BAN36317.1 peptidase M23 [Sulfuricella denitrificans skB26]
MQNNEIGILAQKLFVQERKLSLRWLVAISSLPLFGIVAAFGIAPDTQTRQIPVHTVIENLQLPSAATPSSISGNFWHEEKIQRGDTMSALLDRLNVNDEDISGFMQSARDSKALRLLIPGRIVRAQTDSEGNLLSLQYISSSESMLKVEKQAGGFKTSDDAVPLESRLMMKSAEIRSSLFGATDAANIPDNIAMQIADIFSSDIDFHSDLQKGDKVTVVYESFYNKGELIKTGRVLAAEFINSGKSYRAVYFQDHEGRGGYYTPEGKNLRKAFLRSPLEFSRITSGFTNARFHPVLKTWRAHKGVDYGAPTGTRVKAVADGTVAFIGKQGGYGNLLILQHQGQYSTAYGHLSAFAKGLHKGSKVSQGDVIAQVGMTGVATGPHLHYEFRVAGVQRNPLGIPMPTAFPIATQYKADFSKMAENLSMRLNLLKNTNLASLD